MSPLSAIKRREIAQACWQAMQSQQRTDKACQLEIVSTLMQWLEMLTGQSRQATDRRAQGRSV